MPFHNQLSQYDVSDIVQDDFGYLWIGTYDGLNRYNGVENRIYRVDPDDESSISSNRIKALCFDSLSSVLYVGTNGGGICVYDYGSDSFSRIKLASDGNPLLRGNDILDFASSEDGTLWVSTREAIFLIRYHPDSGSFDILHTIVIEGNDIANSLVCSGSRLMACSNNSGHVRIYGRHGDRYELETSLVFPRKTIINGAVYEEGTGEYYFATSKGICRSGHKGQHPVMIAEGEILAAVSDRQGGIYYYGKESGLRLLNCNDGSTTDVKLRNNELAEWNVRNLYIDRTGVLWLCSSDKGIAGIDLHQKEFGHVDLDCDVLVTRLFMDEDGILWVGTQHKGLIIHDMKSGKSSHYLPHGTISCIDRMPDGNIYVVSSGIVHRAEKNGDAFSFRPIRIEGLDIHPDFGRIFSICEDGTGSKWLGCRFGIMKINPDGKVAYTYPLEIQNQVRMFMDSERNRIWACTQTRGVLEFQLDDSGEILSVSKYVQELGNQESLSSNTVWNMSFIGNDKIYVCTDAGLNIILAESRKVSRFKDKSLLADIKALSAVEDGGGNVWINTTNGIIMFNPDTQSAVKFGASDGLTCGYLTEASCTTEDGYIFVGGNQGISYFQPGELSSDTETAAMVISEMYLSGKPVLANRKYNGRILLTKPIFKTDKIVLSHNQNNISFGLNTSSFRNPDKSRFQYRLATNEHIEWIKAAPNSHLVTFNDVKPGSYRLDVVPLNSEGHPSGNVTSLDIRIKHPIWASASAYMLYLLICAAVLYSVYRHYKRQQTLKNELLIERITHKSENEAYENKVRFMINITHELRTPLSLITAPLKELSQEKLTDNAGELIAIIQRNVDRLLSLVNQFLDLRRLELGKMPLQIQSCDIYAILESAYSNFSKIAEARHIDYRLDICDGHTRFNTDADKFVTMVSNLLSNAFKFTPEHGAITLSAYFQGERLVVEVADNGCGIKEEDQQRIFERFYQTGQSSSSGSGIGLELTKRYAELMKGAVSVKSRLGKGSVFRIELPEVEGPYPAGLPGTTAEHSDGDENRKQILVIDDDNDILMYLTRLLSVKYSVTAASDGRTGYEKALETMPDIIISDVMMPGMDGTELCRQVRQDFRLSHIPVILLTAKDDCIGGLKSGAIDYITKPFDPDALMMKIDNLLDYVRKRAIDNSGEVTLSEKISQFKEEKEKEFLEKAYRSVIDNIDDTTFDIDRMITILGTSRTQLHRKITALTGSSASTFIRNVRLDKAKELLMTGEYTITQVLYSVGFNSPSYFSKTYKERFGILPSDELRS
ncbi:MAG: ATP-binding protein [Candidatus Cryptobacteroides sp.]